MVWVLFSRQRRSIAVASHLNDREKFRDGDVRRSKGLGLGECGESSMSVHDSRIKGPSA